MWGETAKACWELTFLIHDDIGQVDVGKVQLGDYGGGRPALQLQAGVHEHHSGLSSYSVLLHKHK